MLRAVSYIVRDKNWGTYRSRESRTRGRAGGGRLPRHLRRRHAGTPAQEFRSIARRSRRRSTARSPSRRTGEAVTDFLTNRTGFVVLHPSRASPASPARSSTSTGSIVETSFPELIDPVQPMMDLRAITHAFAPGFERHLPHGGRHLRDGGSAQLDRRLLQDLCPAARPALALHARGRRTRSSRRHAQRSQARRRRVARGDGASVVERRRGRRLTRRRSASASIREDAAAALAPPRPLRAARPRIMSSAITTRAAGHDRAALAASRGGGPRARREPWLEAVIREVDGYEAEIAALGRLAARARLAVHRLSCVAGPRSEMHAAGQRLAALSAARQALSRRRAALFRRRESAAACSATSPS